jgi:hypothetical protein
MSASPIFSPLGLGRAWLRFFARSFARRAGRDVQQSARRSGCILGRRVKRIIVCLDDSPIGENK